MKSIIKSKRGLVAETLKLVIAVFCIILLTIFGIKLFKVFILNKNAERAKASLQNLEAKIKYLHENDILETQITLEKIKDWELISPNPDSELCEKGKSCVCICRKNDNKCKKGSCASFDYLVLVYPTIPLDSTKDIVIKKEDTAIMIKPRIIVKIK